MLTVARLKPLMKHWFGLDNCKGWTNPERLTEFANEAVTIAQRDADALNTMLWLYRRLPHAYGAPPFVVKSLVALAQQAGQDISLELDERADKLIAPPYDR